MKVGINDFVRRQTAASPFSHYEGTLEQVAAMAEFKINNGDVELAPVMTISVDPKGFKAGIIVAEEGMEITAEFKARREGEEPYIQNFADADKADASYVQLIIYSHDALAADGDDSTDADYELVSINASFIENEPLSPEAMARNYLHKEGGTKQDYTAEEFARSIDYWKDKVHPKG